MTVISDQDHIMHNGPMRHAFIGLCFAIVASTSQAAPAKVDLNALQRPTVCPAYAPFNAESGLCVIDTTEAAKITDAQVCNRSPMLRFSVDANGRGSCAAVSADGQAATFTADCASLAGHTVKRQGEGKQASCEYSTLDTSASGRGDYVGDCFIIKSAIPGLPVTGSRHWLVTDQDDTNAKDPNLTLVPASDWGPGEVLDVLQRITPIAGCTPKTTPVQPVTMPASTLNHHGAIRRGFVYGLLTTPYKYYPADKSFQSGLPIGPYLGWRVGESGVGGTLVASFTLGAVKANTTKADPNDSTKTVITGQTDLMALSTAVGLVFDITRNPNKSGFKAGVLVGMDHVNQGSNIDYPQHGKRWIAIQLGYDFTDY